MRVLSLFDGIGCGMEALRQLDKPVDEYVSYEIADEEQRVLFERHGNKCVLRGDVQARNKSHREKGAFDVLLAGSPCQGFSKNGKNLGFSDDRSKLYFEFEQALEEIQPKFFLLENVYMSGANEKVITDRLGIQPVKICASTITPQRRPRTYWTNIPFDVPVARKTPSVPDLLDHSNFEPNSVKWHEWFERKKEYVTKKQYVRVFDEFTTEEEKAVCQVARQYQNWQGNMWQIAENKYRFFTPTECERLHGLPDGYTSLLPKNKRYKAIGNGWSIPVVKEILRGI